MEYITTFHGNSINEERQEEHNNWYTYVHLRDELGLPGLIACQRFWRAKYQPKNYDPKYMFYTVYELYTKELFNKSHEDVVSTWKMVISSAMDFKDYKESHWDGLYGTVPYAAHAEFGPESHNLVAMICPREGSDANVEEILSEEVIQKLGFMNGVYAANLYRFGTNQMPKKSASAEKYTHQLILQLEDARDGNASWDAFQESCPALSGLEISICNYVSLMPRLKRCDRFQTPQDRALSSIFTTITKLPGFHIGGGDGRNQTDVLTPAIKARLDAMGK